MIKIKNVEITKILLIIGFLFFLTSLFILISTPAAKGYEISIYQIYPIYYWFFVIGAMLISIVVLIISAIRNRSASWPFAILLLLLNYFVFLSLPLIRGYFLYWRQGDLLEHIGWSKYILTSGQTYVYDPYPWLHILLASLSFFGMPIISSSLFLPSFFSILFFMFLLVLIKKISKDETQFLILASFSAPLFFSYFYLTLHPSIISAYLIPLLLYIYYKAISSEKSPIFYLLLSVLTISFVIMHPVTAIIIILLLSGLILSYFIKRSHFNLKSRVDTLFYMTAIIAIALITWIFSIASLSSGVQRVISVLDERSIEPMASSQLNTLNKTNLDILHQIEIFIRLYGPNFMYFFIAICCFLIVLYYYHKKQIDEIEIDFSIQYIAGIALAIIFFTTYMIEYEPYRVARYAIIIAPLFIGIIFHKLWKISKVQWKKTIIIALMFLIIIPSSLLGFLNVYPSPYSYDANRQLTHMENSGIVWFLDHRNAKMPLIAQDITINSNEAYYFGPERNYLEMEYQIFPGFPSHFGYPSNTTLKKFLENNQVYLLTTEEIKSRNLVFLEELRSQKIAFSDEDFARLNIDPSVAKLYSNREYELWFIQ